MRDQLVALLGWMLLVVLVVSATVYLMTTPCPSVSLCN